jgi:serine/threonine-protein kinase RsbW
VSDELELTLPTRIESVEEAAARAAEFAAERSLDEPIAYAIDMAVREAVANAVKHGNKLDAAKNVEVRLTDTADAVKISVRDFGSGFDVDEVPDPTDPEHLLRTNGRGILFIRSFMDDVSWSAAPGGGRIVKMAKAKP